MRGVTGIVPLDASAYPRLVSVCGLVQAHWLNQIEIYFFIVQGKALTANDVADRLENFLPGD